MAAPVTSVLDSFTRTNESPIAGSWAGPLTSGSGLDLNTNQLAANSGIFQSSYWNTSFLPDQEVFATLAVLPGAGDNMELHARASNPGASAVSYYLQFKGGAPQQLALIWRDSGGVGHGLASDTATTWVAGDKMWLRCSGTTIEGYRYNGTTWSLLLQVTDSNVTGAGYIGATIDASVARFDDFGGGTLGQVLLPDADVAAGGWATAPLFSKLNDSSDATVITATAS